MTHSKARPRRMRPQRVEQRFALGYAEPENISVPAATKEKPLATGLRIVANDRMTGTHRLAKIGDFLVALAQYTRTVARSVVHRKFALDCLFEVSVVLLFCQQRNASRGRRPIRRVRLR